MGLDAATTERFSTHDARKAGEDELEALLADWTRSRTQQEVEEALQGVGIEAVAVLDFGDLHEDPQLLARDHFVTLPHAVCGEWLFERNGFRVSATPSGYTTACPILGEHTDDILRNELGLPEDEVEALLQSDGVETELLLKK